MWLSLVVHECMHTIQIATLSLNALTPPAARTHALPNSPPTAHTAGFIPNNLPLNPAPPTPSLHSDVALHLDVRRGRHDDLLLGLAAIPGEVRCEGANPGAGWAPSPFIWATLSF